VSMITPTLMKFAHQHRDAVLSLLSPSWTADDFDQFVKGLVSLVDKQEDIPQVCHAIREGFLSHHSLVEVETCYRHLHKYLKQKPITNNSPKRRRAISKPEPVNPSMVSSIPSPSDGPLPAMGGLTLNSPPTSFSFLTHQMQNHNNHNNHNSNQNPSHMTSPFTYGVPSNSNSAPNTVGSGHPSTLSFSSGALMRPHVEYGTVPSVMDMDLNSPALSLNSLGTLAPPAWNSLSFSFDLQSVPPSLGIQQGAPMVSSHN